MAFRANSQSGKHCPWKLNCPWRDATNRWTSTRHCVPVTWPSGFTERWCCYTCCGKHGRWRPESLEGLDFPPKGQLFSGCPARRLYRQHCGPRWGSGKENETGGKGAGHDFWKNDIAQGHNINPLKSSGSKMADKSNSTKPWSSVCKLNDTPRGDMTVPRHYEKTKKWVVPQLFEWSSHSLAYEFIQLTKTNHTFHGHHIHPLRWHTLCGLCFFLNPNKSTSYLSLCLTEFFLQWDIKNLSFIRSWNQAPWALARLKFWLDTTEWLSIAQSPCHMGLSPNLR